MEVDRHSASKLQYVRVVKALEELPGMRWRNHEMMKEKKG